MDEFDENVRASLSEAIHPELIQHDARTNGEPIRQFVLSGFMSCELEPEPVASGSENEEAEDKEETNPRTVKEFCRMCLCDDRKLSTIPQQNRVAFQCVLHQDEESERSGVSLPQKVCWQCNDRMTSFKIFRTKAVQTDNILYSLIRPFMNVNENSETINPAEIAGYIGHSRCFVHRQDRRPQPYEMPSEENINRRARRLSFCVLQRNDRRPEEPQQPE